jgi:TRAP-type C4-dicarboxylate transport system permease large subunit
MTSFSHAASSPRRLHRRYDSAKQPFVVYGITAQASIGKLFLGGIVPGVLSGLLLMIFTYVYSKKRGWKGVDQEREVRPAHTSHLGRQMALLVPVIVLGGIYGGIMTRRKPQRSPPCTVFVAGL